MDYLAFTKMRTQFLRSFYAQAATPFNETRRKIEAFEHPFEAPSGYEDAEPPFLGEWQEAGDALDVLGQSVASLATQALKLYVEHWIAELLQRASEEQLARVGVGIPSDPVYKPDFKNGWFSGYRTYCSKLGVDWRKSSVDLTLLEQLILARNSIQHTENVTSVRIRQRKADIIRFPNGFFADEIDLRWNESLGINSMFSLPPHLDISAGKLSHALDQVDAFCSWLDGQHPMRRSVY